MSFPKKGKSFPKSGDPNNSNGDGGNLNETLNFALEVATALERTLRDRNTRIKTVAGWTGANERTVKNWLSGQYGPCGAHLVVLIQHSDDVLNAVLSMASRHDLVVAQKLVDLEQRMVELVSTVPGSTNLTGRSALVGGASNSPVAVKNYAMS